MMLEKVDYIAAVAEEQNLTRAAARLYLSQPALTSYLNRLESELGVKLFDRSKTPIQITKAGKFYLQQMKKLYSTEQAIRHDVQAIANPEKTFTLGIGQVRGHIWLPLLLPPFCDKYPNINIKAKQDVESKMVSAILDNTMDIAFGVMPSYLSDELKRIDISTPEHLLLVAHHKFGLVPDNVRDKYSAAHPFPITPEQLQKLPFISPEVGNGLYSALEYIVAEYKLHPAQIITVNNLLTGLQLTERGLGVQLIYKAVLNYTGVLQIDQLDFCVLDKMPLESPCSAIFRDDNIKLEQIMKLIEIVKEKVLPELKI